MVHIHIFVHNFENCDQNTISPIIYNFEKVKVFWNCGGAHTLHIIGV